MHVEYGDDELDSVGHFLSSLNDTLAMASELTGIGNMDKEICLESDSDENCCPILRMVLEEIQHTFSHNSRAVWLSLQAAAAAKHMRRDLKTRAPGVVLQSNVESEVDGL